MGPCGVVAPHEYPGGAMIPAAAPQHGSKAPWSSLLMTFRDKLVGILNLQCWAILINFRQSGRILPSITLPGKNNLLRYSRDGQPLSAALAKKALAQPSRLNLVKTKFTFSSPVSRSSPNHPGVPEQIDCKAPYSSLIVGVVFWHFFNFNFVDEGLRICHNAT